MTPARAIGPPAMGDVSWADNWTLGQGTLHGEIMHAESRAVWLAQEPLTIERFDALELPEGFVRSGIGESVADVAYFGRSPGADDDGPLETMQVGGVRFARVARPGEPEPGFRGVLVLPVEKFHRVLFAAGRTIEVMDCGDGADYVPLVANARMPGAPPGDPGRSAVPRALPGGWSVRTLTLDADLLVDLPCPTRAVFFFRRGESFQGPVRLGL